MRELSFIFERSFFRIYQIYSSVIDTAIDAVIAQANCRKGTYTSMDMLTENYIRLYKLRMVN